MSEFTPGMKKAVDKHLKKMNEELAKAIANAKAGSNAGAIDHIKKAIAEKQKVIAALPGVEDADGITIPFAAIYDIFSEFDDLAFLVGQYIALIRAHAKPGISDELIEALIERINRAIEQMRRFIDRFTWPPGVQPLLDGMIDELEKLRQLLKAAADGKPVDWKDVERSQRLIWAYKKGFFEAFKSALPLWDIYDMLFHIDEDLASGLSGLGRGYPPDSRSGRSVRWHIEHAKDTKEKLERLLHDATYPPGGEDLPPFPPPDWAIREAERLGGGTRRAGGGRGKG